MNQLFPLHIYEIICLQLTLPAVYIENMDWYIDANTLENVITNLTGTNIEIQGCTQCIEIEKDGTILECLANNRERKNMKIMKIDDMISIEECEVML